jgi:hypothetical protein
MKRLLFAPLIFALSGCAQFGSPSCLLPLQKPMFEAQLFFGRDISGRGPVSDTEWSGFAAETLTKNFPDGFTVADGEGQWFDPDSKAVIREPSKIVTIVAPRDGDLGARLNAVARAYREKFHQQSVGVVTAPVCAAF